MNQKEMYNDLVSTPISVAVSSMAYSAVQGKKVKVKKAGYLAVLMGVYGITLEEIVSSTLADIMGADEDSFTIETLTNFVGLYLFNMGISKVYPRSLPLSQGVKEGVEPEPGIIYKPKSKTGKLIMESALVSIATTLLTDRMDDWYADGDKVAKKQRKSKRKKTKRRAMGKKKSSAASLTKPPSGFNPPQVETKPVPDVVIPPALNPASTYKFAWE